MENSVSLLLGAGFSAPMGYPIGNTLNDNLLNCSGNEFSFSTGGQLMVSVDGSKPNFGNKTSYDLEFEFGLTVIKYFKQMKGYFDYEEFYDFICETANQDVNVQSLANPYIKNGVTVSDLLYSFKTIYIQVVGFYLKDGQGKNWYDDEAFHVGSFYPYTGILSCLEKLSTQNIINVHTLNHDLFFERLNYTSYINGELCDGFEERGSNYYGVLKSNNRGYHCRLERYTGLYDKKFRLFKLHGSRDYALYHSSDEFAMTPKIYVKTRYGISLTDLLRETDDGNGQLIYERCWVNYHADFLTGTTSKISRYTEPLLFKILFDHFKNNLQIADKLIIAGYGGKDSEVNNILLSNFDYKKKECYIIDPYPGNQVETLAGQLGAKLIVKHLQGIEYSDLGIK